MPAYRRLYVPGGTYFFTVALQDRRATHLTTHIDLLRASYAATAKAHPFETLAICILPDHLHAIWTLPDNDGDFSTRWRLIKSGFSRALPQSLDAGPRRRIGERNIWQRRFWEHLIRNEEECEAYINYIHGNPAKHGYVEDINDWEYSSWHRHKQDEGKEYIPPTTPLKTGEP